VGFLGHDTHTAIYCNTFNIHCNNTLQHTATLYNRLQHTATCLRVGGSRHTHCNTLHHIQHALQQHIATHCNTLQHTATHCNTLQQSTHNTLQHTCAWVGHDTHTAIYCNTFNILCNNTLQHTVTHCNTIQHTRTHCNTPARWWVMTHILQNTATHSTYTATTHCNTL